MGRVAAESLLFDTYRMLLIEEGLSAGELAASLDRERSFKSLLVREMPSRLGGRWDVSQEETPVGKYWRDLYTVRNAVVHRGSHAHGGEAEAAQEAYWALRDHLEERLMANRAKYPRTALARLGQDRLEASGVLQGKMLELVERLVSEPEPWYWPSDVAGRSDSA